MQRVCFLYRNLGGPLKEHIFWFLVTFCFFCAWTDTGINSTHTRKIILNHLSVYSPLTMQAHNLATSSAANCPAFNFLRDTINHQSAMIIYIITFLPGTIAATIIAQEVWHSLDEFHLAKNFFSVLLCQMPMISDKTLGGS